MGAAAVSDLTGLARIRNPALARSAADGDQAALEVFDAFIAIAQRQWQRLADHDLLRSGTDLTWTTLHAVVFVLGTVLLRGAVERHLPQPFYTPEQLERWNAASNALFKEGTSRITPRMMRQRART
jgi:hypothetical protein